MKRWFRFFMKCAAATWLVHTATGLDWLQAFASVALVLWGALEAVRVLERLLGAFLGHCGVGSEAPEKGDKPIVIWTEGPAPNVGIPSETSELRR